MWFHDGVRKRDPDGGWRRTATRNVFECPFLTVRQDDITLPNGERIQYHVIERGHFTTVVPIRSDGQVVMERIHRWPLQAWTLECPSGGIEAENPEEGARRELLEETGYVAKELIHLGNYAASDGYSDERMDVFLAPDVRDTGVPTLEATEQIEIELHSLAALKQMVLKGELEDAPSALSILLAAERLGT